MIAVHVDDFLIGSTDGFHFIVVERLRRTYPFKHWKMGKSNRFGNNLVQQADISIDQCEDVSNVQYH